MRDRQGAPTYLKFQDKEFRRVGFRCNSGSVFTRSRPEEMAPLFAYRRSSAQRMRTEDAPRVGGFLPVARRFEL
jgi:hypothetical protein